LENSRKAEIAQVLAMFGGVYYAYTKKSSIWGYMGYGFLFSVVGGIIARKVFNVSVWTKTTSALPPTTSSTPTPPTNTEENKTTSNVAQAYKYDASIMGLTDQTNFVSLDVIDANSNKDGLARYKEEDTSSYTGMPIYSKGESQRFQPHSNPILANKGYMEVTNSPNAKEYLKSNTSKGFYRNGKRVDQVYWFPKDALTKYK
jgi:hypothetical protein